MQIDPVDNLTFSWKNLKFGQAFISIECTQSELSISNLSEKPLKISDTKKILHVEKGKRFTFKGEKDEYTKKILPNLKIQSRAITPENPTGEKGKAAMLPSELGPSRKGRGAIPLTSGEETVIADITGTGIIRHMWMTIRDRTEFGSFVLRDLILRIYWDGSDSPAVESPLGISFVMGLESVAR